MPHGFEEDQLARLPRGDWVTAQVVERREWAAGLVSVVLDRTVEAEAGQFVQLALPHGDDWVKRSYSLASAPGEPAEFFLTRVEGGALSPSLIDLQPGDQLALDRRAVGVFTLDRVPDAQVLWLVATGTGLAPYIAMLRTDEPWERFERIVVVYGARRAAQLAYLGELEELSREHDDRLVIVPVVSREPEAEGVVHGRVTNLAAVEERAGTTLSPETSQVLLCGNPAMVQEMKGLLADRGMRRNRRRAPGHVTTERYW